MKRIFHLVFGALAMLAVALCSAFISMRLAIHGREVSVPNLSRLSLPEAEHIAAARGLRLTLEDRFYSADVPVGHVLAQSPSPGVKVRHEWAIRVTESMGPQQVSIPEVVGQSERPASIALRRVGLESGTLAHLPYEAPEGTVIAQTPLPHSEGVERPIVSLLLADTKPPQPVESVVMPPLDGLTLAAASARIASAGLHLVSGEHIMSPRKAQPNTEAAPGSPEPAAVPPPSIATVVAQTPAAGFRVLRGAPVHITLAN